MLKELYSEHLYTDHLPQMLTSYSTGAKSNCWVYFVNKIFLEHTHVIVYL